MTLQSDCRTDNAVKNRWASLTKKNPRLADGSPGSAPSDSSFSGSMPSQSGQSNQGPLQPTRMPGVQLARKPGVILRHVSLQLHSFWQAQLSKLSRVTCAHACQTHNDQLESDNSNSSLSERELIQRRGLVVRLHLPPLLGLISFCNPTFLYLAIVVPHTQDTRAAVCMQAQDQAGFAASPEQVMQSPTRCPPPTALSPSTCTTSRPPLRPRGQA